jgi:hypothetical protein
VRSLTRFSDKGLIPPLSEEQKHAMTVLEETCQKLALHMILEVGDIQFVSNTHLLHARTAYTGKIPPLTTILAMKVLTCCRPPSSCPSKTSSSAMAIYSRN